MSASALPPVDGLDPALLSVLADGAFHSGEALGQRLGISRAAVWKRVARLGEFGVDIEAVRGMGYRIAGGLSLLDADAISARSGLPVSVLWSTGSTSEDAMQRLAAGDSAPFAVLAEHQRAGRGRRGRHWASPLAGNLYMSLAWRFPVGAPRLEGLSLAVGVVIADVLERQGLGGRVGLKWPNDIWVGRRKIGGVLIELSGNLEDACAAVIGIGINGHLPAAAATDIDQPWTDLWQETGVRPDRTLLAGELLGRLVALLEQFADAGFAPWQARWQALDALCGKQVTVATATRSIEGRARGVDAHGALQLEVQGDVLVFHGGEVSLRESGTTPARGSA